MSSVLDSFKMSSVLKMINLSSMPIMLPMWLARSCSSSQYHVGRSLRSVDRTGSWSTSSLISSSVNVNSCVLLTGVCRQAKTLIQTSNAEPFLRTASVERAAADAAAKKQAAEAKIASLGVTAPERTASAEIKQLASRQAMVRMQTSLPCNPSHPREFQR